jgi:phosphatidylglycerophosphate synthase
MALACECADDVHTRPLKFLTVSLETLRSTWAARCRNHRSQERHMRNLLSEARRHLNVPAWESTASNWLTLSRMQLGAFSVILGIVLAGWKVGFALYVWFVFTDFLDGQIARITGTKSEWGRYGDPAGDKLFIDPLVVAGWFYYGQKGEHLIFLSTILAYDGFAMVARSWDGGMKTLVIAKVKQCCLFVAVGIPIAQEAGLIVDPGWWARSALWLTTALVVVSFIMYSLQRFKPTKQPNIRLVSPAERPRPAQAS